MKRLLTALVAIVLFAAPVLASHYWKVDMSTPASLTNRKTFNVEFVSSSVDPDDDITVELFQNGVSQGSQTTTAPYGDSGALSVTVPSDGSYEYFMTTSSSIDGAGPNTPTKTVTVDTTAPGTPSYAGKSRSGNTYTLTFTAPSSGDVATIRIYSSSSSSFTADASTQIAVVNVAPGETKTFSYTAGSSAERFHALQAFDNAGNFSPLVGDPNVVVAQGAPASGGATGGAATSSASTVAAAAEGAGATDQTTADGAQPEGQVLGEQQAGGFIGSGWSWLLFAALAILLAYYLFILRPARMRKTNRK